MGYLRGKTRSPIYCLLVSFRFFLLLQLGYLFSHSVDGSPAGSLLCAMKRSWLSIDSGFALEKLKMMDGFVSCLVCTDRETILPDLG